MNTNPNAKKILCIGDSLTWGYIPESSHGRYPSNIRWTGILQNMLGNNYEIIEEGLNSRGIKNGDPRPGKEGREAINYIIPCIDSHEPIDFIIILLGTNELKFSNHQTPQQTKENMRQLINLIQNHPSQFKTEKPQIILLSPPIIIESTEYCKENNKYKDAEEKSKILNTEYASLANELNINFISLTGVKTGADGIHIEPDAHKKIGEQLATTIISIPQD